MLNYEVKFIIMKCFEILNTNKKCMLLHGVDNYMGLKIIWG